MWWIFGWQIFCQFSPGKIGLNFVTENLIRFFTSRKDICHLELTLGESLPNRVWEIISVSKYRSQSKPKTLLPFLTKTTMLVRGQYGLKTRH